MYILLYDKFSNNLIDFHERYLLFHLEIPIFVHTNRNILNVKTECGIVQHQIAEMILAVAIPQAMN